jgi:hypothetical protein
MLRRFSFESCSLQPAENHFRSNDQARFGGSLRLKALLHSPARRSRRFLSVTLCSRKFRPTSLQHEFRQTTSLPITRGPALGRETLNMRLSGSARRVRRHRHARSHPELHGLPIGIPAAVLGEGEEHAPLIPVQFRSGMFSIRSARGLQRLAGCVSLVADTLGWNRAPREELMHWRRALAALSIALALAACANGTAGQAGALHPPHSPEDNGIRPERGGGDGGGGGGAM